MPRCPTSRPWCCPLTLVFISFSIPHWTSITIILLPDRQTMQVMLRVKKGRVLCLAFIEHTKVFDSVNRYALWTCLARLGCPPKCVNITRQLPEYIKGCVLYDGEQSGSFNINTGVKQGCGLAPALISIFLAAFISLAAVDQANGVGIIYRIDGELAVQHAPP